MADTSKGDLQLTGTPTLPPPRQASRLIRSGYCTPRVRSTRFPARGRYWSSTSERPARLRDVDHHPARLARADHARPRARARRRAALRDPGIDAGGEARPILSAANGAYAAYSRVPLQRAPPRLHALRPAVRHPALPGAESHTSGPPCRKRHAPLVRRHARPFLRTTTAAGPVSSGARVVRRRARREAACGRRSNRNVGRDGAVPRPAVADPATSHTPQARARRHHHLGHVEPRQRGPTTTLELAAHPPPAHLK